MTGPTQRYIRVSLIRVNRNKLAIEERVVRDDGERAEMVARIRPAVEGRFGEPSQEW